MRRSNALSALWLAIASGLALAWAWLLAHNVPRGDDLAYLDWARGHRDHLLDVFRSPPPFPGARPMNALAWWVGGRDATGRTSAGLECALWILALFTWAGWARSRAGWSAAAWTLAFMLATPWFRDLPTWRSWMTTTGACAFLGAALWALEARRPAVALVVGLVAIGFKENAGLVLVLAATLVYRRFAVGGILALALVPGFVHFASGGAGFLPASLVAHARDYVGDVGGAVWPAVMTLSALHPAVGAIAFAGHWFPVALGIVALGAGAVWAARRRSPWALVIAGSWALPLCYATHNPVYLLEGSLVGIVLFASSARPAWVLLLALAPTIWTLSSSKENALWQAAEWRVARTIIREQSTEPAAIFHLAADAHDSQRFAAWWLQHERGWTATDAEGGTSIGEGLTKSARTR